MNLDLFELIAFIFYIVVIGAFAVISVIMAIKIVKLSRKNAQLTLDRNIYYEQLSKIKDDQSDIAAEETRGYIKFVSDSRDKAFEYIEDVQQALMVYDVALNTDDAKIINEAYKKLISFLPKDDMVS